MAVRMVGVDDADPRLPQGVIDASQGLTAADFAPGDTLGQANAYTDAAVVDVGGFVGAFTTAGAPAASTVPTGSYYFDTTVASPFFSDGTDWVGSGVAPGPTPATGATAGSPGVFTPTGAAIPVTVGQLQLSAIAATPATAWTAGQHVIVGDSSLAHWDGDSWEAGPAPTPLTVAFTAVTGETFAPKIGLTAATTITWRTSAGVTLGTGDEPSFTVPGDGEIEMVVADKEAVEYLNFGFDHTQDAGNVSLPADYDWPPTSLTGVATSMVELPNLRYFMAADTDLVGHLDFAGCSGLEYIECFHAHVETADITGCTGMVRICFETCALSHVDLTPTRLTLADFRAADQTGPPPMVVECVGDLPALYHYCVQGNVGADLVGVSAMPALREWWAWDQSDAALTADELPVSPLLRNVRLEGNPYDATSIGALLTRLADLGYDATPAQAGDSFGGTLLAPDAATPPSGSNGARAFLASRNWSLTLPAAAGDTTSAGIWPAHSQDGTADGWARVGTGPAPAVYNGRLTAAWTGYSRIIRTAAEAGSLANVELVVTADRESFGTDFWGVFVRSDGSGVNGARALINGVTGAARSIGLSDSASAGNSTITTLAAVPAGWTAPGAHTVAITVSAFQVTVALDGTDCYRATPAPAGGIWGGYHFGFCGAPLDHSRTWQTMTIGAP